MGGARCNIERYIRINNFYISNLGVQFKKSILRQPLFYLTLRQSILTGLLGLSRGATVLTIR